MFVGGGGSSSLKGLYYQFAISSLKAGQHFENIAVFKVPEWKRGFLVLWKRSGIDCRMFLLMVTPLHITKWSVWSAIKMWTKRLVLLVTLKTQMEFLLQQKFSKITRLGGILTDYCLYSQLAYRVCIPWMLPTDPSLSQHHQITMVKWTGNERATPCKCISLPMFHISAWLIPHLSTAVGYLTVFI